MDKLSRRGFLARSGSAVIGTSLLTDVGLQGATRSPGGPGRRLAPSGGQVRDIEIECARLEKMLDGTRCRLRAFNGSVPGPLLEVNQGDLLRIAVRNRLPRYDSEGWNGDHNVPHDLNTTNLHLHGLEIEPHLFEPVGTSNPTAEMIAIEPGADYRYGLQVPTDQPPGLYWYHAHHHGSTAVQAVSGMAGGLIVRGELDRVPEIAAAREVPLVFQDIGLFPTDDREAPPDLWEYNPIQNSIWNTLDSYVHINGQVDSTLNGGFTTGDYKLRYFLLNGEPFFKEVHNYEQGQETMPIGTQLGVMRIPMRPGEVARFRVLNANSDDLMPLTVEGHELHLIARDGVNFDAPRTIPPGSIYGGIGDEQLLLAPANRAEFLLRASATPGIYSIVQLGQAEQFLTSERRVVAEIEVVGAPVSMGIPRELPPPSRHRPLIQPSDIKRRRNIVFSMQVPGWLNPTVGLDFMINNELYDERVISSRVQLQTAEEWHVSVPSPPAGSEGHPFHIHVNSFEVISVGGTELPPGTIQDTLWIPANTEAVIRMKFKEWVGKSVYHCHILPHEDTGMMQNFLIEEG